MKTVLQIVDLLWSKVDNSELTDEISGDVYKHLRPAGSKLEDIIINTLPFTNEQLQRGIANVNIYVPNKPVTINNIEDQNQPDHVRLAELADMAIAILSDTWESDLHYDVQQHVLIRDEQTGEHYINIRIEFFIENL
jgi:hypothetical protein